MEDRRDKELNENIRVSNCNLLLVHRYCLNDSGKLLMEALMFYLQNKIGTHICYTYTKYKTRQDKILDKVGSVSWN